MRVTQRNVKTMFEVFHALAQNCQELELKHGTLKHSDWSGAQERIQIAQLKDGLVGRITGDGVVYT